MMSKLLTGKQALVTGGSSGIGQAIAIGLAKAGAGVILTYRNNRRTAQKTVAVIESFGQKGEMLHCDFSEKNCVVKLMSEASKRVEYFDILINNAASITRSQFLEISAIQLEHCLSTNFIAPFQLLQAVSRLLIANSKPGSLINVSSLSAGSAMSKMADYQSSKAALSMLTKSAAYELASHQIRVNTISPGLTRTPGNQDHWDNNPKLWAERSSHIPLGRAGDPKDYVGAAVYLASDHSKWVTGANIAIDGGQSVI